MKIQINPLDKKAPFDAIKLSQYAKQLAAFQIPTTDCKEVSNRQIKVQKNKNGYRTKIF